MRSTSEGGSAFGGFTLLAGIYAFITTPALTGLKGAFTAAMIGAGTAVVTVPAMAIGGLGGAAVGAFAGRMGSNRGSYTLGGAIVGGILGALAALVTAAPMAYDLAHDVALKGHTTALAERQGPTTPAKAADIKIAPAPAP